MVIDDGTRKVGFGEYIPEINCDLIEGNDFTDTLIGADGDTLESLSDQMDGLTSSKFTNVNEFGPGE